MTFGRHYEMFLSQAGSNVTTLANIAIKLNDTTFDLNAYPIQIATVLRLKAWEKYQEYTLQNLRTGISANFLRVTRRVNLINVSILQVANVPILH